MRFVPFALPPNAMKARLARLTWEYRKWDTHVRGRDTTTRGALVLTRREHDEVVRSSEELYALADDAMRRWPHEDHPELGVDPALKALARGPGPRVTRIDFFLTQDGWRVSEMNDDAPGGYNDALGLVAVFADAVDKGLEVPGDLPEALLRLLAGKRVGLVYATAYAEDLQVVQLLADLLAVEGIESVLASPAHLEDDGKLAGQDVDVLYRFFPSEWYPALPNLEAWRNTSARVVNPFSCAWTQSKASFALLQHPTIPLTMPFDAKLALAQRERFVLKPCFGRMGEGVVIGAHRTEHEWRNAVAGASRRPSVLQQRFQPLPIEVSPGVTAHACVGAYVVNGEFAGYYSRLSTTNDRVVRFDASNVLTLLETV